VANHLPASITFTSAMASMKILILGSGMVAPPCLEYLTRSPENRITLGMIDECAFRELLTMNSV
jgi:hypothetical protein